MRVRVVLLPRELRPEYLQDRNAVVFDVLRATSTMTAALSGGVKEIRIFSELDAAADACRAFEGAKVLVGEKNCLPPVGFDLGNSPEPLTHQRGQTVFMCTTNGTRAILSASLARRVFIGSLLNASAIARELRNDGRDATLLCAGTNGEPAMEDLLGTGAVLDALRDHEPDGDLARAAECLFKSCGRTLEDALRDTIGGRNVIDAGLEADIAYAARLDALDVVGEATGSPVVVRRIRST